MKKCPYCAEDIQDAATVCRHCGRALPPEKKKRSRLRCFGYIVIVLVAGCLILTVIGILLPDAPTSSVDEPIAILESTPTSEPTATQEPTMISMPTVTPRPKVTLYCSDCAEEDILINLQIEPARLTWVTASLPHGTICEVIERVTSDADEREWVSLDCGNQNTGWVPVDFIQE